jgi:phosphoribosylamine--glycine ligase
MRFLGMTETCDLGALYMRLAEAGHEVRISISEEEARGTLAGLVPRTEDWRGELDWIRDAGDDGVILFEAVSDGFGALQDDLRRKGFAVVGGSRFGDRLENDRAYAQAMLAGLGFGTAGIHAFSDADSADDFLAAHPGRYVLKFSGADHVAGDTYVGQLADGRDVRAMLAARLSARDEAPAGFVLMDRLEGVEVGVGAYFNGERFLTPACLDWEHKRFFANDLGELTGEMGTVATYEGTGQFFNLTLARIEPVLREQGHVGYVNLNTIVNEDGIWPLEFTCRFGYPGFAVLDPLQDIEWGELLRMIATRSRRRFPVSPGFSLGVVLTTPPFPYSRKEIAEPVGLPVVIPDSFRAEDHDHVHIGEVGLAEGQLVTSGLYGWTMVVTGTGPTIACAKRAAYERATRISIPNVRYRLDIGDRLIAGQYAQMDAMGLLGDG